MAERRHYRLRISGVGIAFSSSQPLPVTERFAPFLTEERGTDFFVEYREVPALTVPLGEPVYKGERFWVWQEENGVFSRWYFDGMQGNAFFARSRQDRADHVQVDYSPIGRELVSDMGNCFSFCGWEMLLLQKERLLLHASCVDTPLGGLLFSGPSGIGKSTQAELWRQYAGAELINGDRPILSRDEQGWHAWGSPYAGSSRRFVNESCALRALVLLKQAKSCDLRRLCGADAFRRVFAGATANSWDRTSVQNVCRLTEQLVSDLPVYELSCTPDRAAVELLRAELEREASI